jgi:hypothetical protein
MHFSDLGLKAELLRAVADQGYDTPTPIQQQAIPAVMTGRTCGHGLNRHCRPASHCPSHCLFSGEPACEEPRAFRTDA